MKEKVSVVYDGECPVCRTYCELFEANYSQVTTLLDARDNSDLMREITD